MLNPEDYTTATRELARLGEQHQRELARLEEVKRYDLDTIWEEKEKLRREEEEAKQGHDDARKAAVEAHKRECAPFAETVAQTRRRFALMEIARRGKVATMGQVYGYSSGYPREKVILQRLDTLAADEYKQVGVWVVPNGKPKNKWSLIVRGWSLFASYETLGLKKYGFGYAPGVNEEPYANIEATLRDDHDEAQLHSWYVTKKASILKDFLAEHAKVEAEYRDAAVLLRDPGWLRLYLEDQKDYYENHYSGGTSQPEYKAVSEELAALST